MIIFYAVCITISLAYLCIIGIYTIGWFRLKEYKPAQNNRDYISVVVAMRNEEHNIKNLLTALSRQNHPLDLFEVIIIDDHSDDHSCLVVEAFIKANPNLNIRLIRISDESGFSKKPCLNEGFKNARGNIIITTDADCVMPEGWISIIARVFGSSQKIQFVSAPVYMYPGATFFGQLQSLEFSSLIASGAGSMKMGCPVLCNGANLAFRKEVMDRTEPYLNKKTVSGDDVFLMFAVLKALGPGALCFLKNFQAVVKTSPKNGLKSFINQRVRWAAKGTAYKNFFAAFSGWTLVLFNFSIILTAILSVFSSDIFFVFAGLWLFKFLLDLPLSIGISIFYKQVRLMKFYPVLQILYPVYITITALLSFFKGFEWKGRKSRG